MKIPLLRPRMPDNESICKYFQMSRDAGVFSNFGPCHELARKRIQELTTYNTLVSNATVGLELALRARLKPGSRVLMPSFTFKATYCSVVNAGMIPILNVVDEKTWLVSPHCEYDALIVVSPFGRPVPFEKYECLNVPVFFDLAGAWGQHYKGNQVALYSFHATKNLSIGEGGCVVSNDLELIEKISWLSRFQYTNAKLSEIQCSVLLAALDLSQTSSISLNVRSFTPTDVYKIISNEVFSAKRYYYPLIEDLYPNAERINSTPQDHPTRSTVSIPRDVTDQEKEIVENHLAEILEK